MQDLHIIRSNRWSISFLAVAIILGQVSHLLGNPTGGQVVSGSANINTGPGLVTVNQGSTSAIINWQNFSINLGETTKFLVPSVTSATLNRVVGGNLSTIYGTLQSNGQVYLLNPNGILVGATGRIDTAGFIGSTLNISDAQFNQQGDLNFLGTSSAGVNNQGTIHASGGDVYLIASQVSNSGTISASSGTVGLAAGTQVLLQKAGDQHLFVQASGGAAAQSASGITNSGAISAAAAELKAAGGNAYALAINNTGNIAATGITKINGQVYLTAEGGDITNTGNISAKQANGDGGTVVVNAHSTTASPTQGTVQDSGTITATGTAPGTVGGTVNLLGDRVGLTGSAVVDVSGDAGGGTALVGGDEHGANAGVPNASQTYLGPTATIRADATTTGNGGKVILWADDTTQAYGNISVRGGAQSGNGGFVETSGHYLDAQMAPDLSAPHGNGGTWLLDPIDLNIVATGSSTISPIGSDPTEFAPTNSEVPDQLVVGDILTALRNGDVSIVATGDSDSSIFWQSGANLDFSTLSSGMHNLTLTATGVISLTGVTISNTSPASGASLNLTLNPNFSNFGSGSIYLGQGVVQISNSTINLNGGTFTANGNAAGLPIGDFTGSGTPMGVWIGGSTITTGGVGGISISGTGATSNTTSAEGVVIDNSTLTLGSAVTTDTGYFNITGFSDPGSNNNTIINPSGGNTPFGATSSYGVLVTNSHFISYSPGSSGGVDIEGQSFADNNAAAMGVEISGSTLTTFNGGQAKIKGKVKPETFLGETPTLSEANHVYGIYLGNSQITASGNAPSAGTSLINIEGSVSKDVIATNFGETNTTDADSYGVSLDNDALSTSGDTTLLSVAMNVVGNAGQAIAESSSTGGAISEGVNIWDGTTLTNNGLGVTAIAGLAGNVTGTFVNADGVSIAGFAESPHVLNSPNGGTIAIAGLGGMATVAPGATSFFGEARGVVLNSGGSPTTPPIDITTTTGSIFIVGAAGSSSGFTPDLGTMDASGIELNEATLQTNPTTANGAQIPPLVVLYGTDNTFVHGANITGAFQLASPNNSGAAISESSDSSIQTGHLVLGNYYDLLTAYAPASLVSSLPTLTAFNNLLSTDSGTISTEGITFNPGGAISLTSHSNQIGYLDSALIGTGGIDLYDSTSLVVDPIGSTDNMNYGQIDLPAQGPVFIQTPGNLTLTPDSALTNTSSQLPVIATSGAGNDITLVDGGIFTNLDTNSAPALSTSNGSIYTVYSNNSSLDALGNLAPNYFVYSTSYPASTGQSGSGIAFSLANMGPGPSPKMLPINDDPGNPDNPFKSTQDALLNLNPADAPGTSPITGSTGNTVTKGSDVVGGAGGVAKGKDLKMADFANRLAQIYGRHDAAQMLLIFNKDIRDGSTVNTGTLLEKWAANTGLSKMVRPGTFALMGNGLVLPGPADDSSNSDSQLLDSLSSVVFGPAQNRGPGGNRSTGR